MIGEVDLGGVLVAPLIIWMLLGYLVGIPIRRLLSLSGFYRLVWHPALFDAALFVILTGVVNALANAWLVR